MADNISSGIDSDLHTEIVHDIITRKDKAILETGLTKLAKQLQNTETDKLPRGIVLPEASTHALPHALLPILRKIYQQKGVDTPPILFLKTPPSRPITSERLSPLERIIKTQANIEEVEKGINITKLRAEEIVKYIKDGPLLIIDDVVASQSANTIRRVTQAIKDSDPNRSVSLFVFISEGGDTSISESTPEKGLNISVGTYVPGFVGVGFSWRDGPIRNKVLGVEKKNNDSLYVKRSIEADPKLMKKLRQELKNVGNNIAAQI